MKKFILSEEETNDIKSQHEDINRKVMNFLLRRVEKKERIVGIDDEYTINVVEITFSDLPGYGFNSFSSRKDMERQMLEMLEENGVIDLGEYDTGILDTDRQKLIKTVRSFLSFIMPRK
jgi:hypothetical protein